MQQSAEKDSDVFPLQDVDISNALKLYREAVEADRRMLFTDAQQNFSRAAHLLLQATELSLEVRTIPDRYY